MGWQMEVLDEDNLRINQVVINISPQAPTKVFRSGVD